MAPSQRIRLVFCTILLSVVLPLRLAAAQALEPAASITIKATTRGLSIEAGFELVLTKGLPKIVGRLLGPIGIAWTIGEVGFNFIEWTPAPSVEEMERDWDTHHVSPPDVRQSLRNYFESPPAPPPPPPPPPPPSVITLAPLEQLTGEVLRIRYAHLTANGGIEIAGGTLVVEEDGKMRFRGTWFQGYATVQQDGTITLRDENGVLVYDRGLEKKVRKALSEAPHAP